MTGVASGSQGVLDRFGDGSAIKGLGFCWGLWAWGRFGGVDLLGVGFGVVGEPKSWDFWNPASAHGSANSTHALNLNFKEYPKF